MTTPSGGFSRVATRSNQPCPAHPVAQLHGPHGVVGIEEGPRSARSSPSAARDMARAIGKATMRASTTGWIERPGAWSAARDVNGRLVMLIGRPYGLTPNIRIKVEAGLSASATSRDVERSGPNNLAGTVIDMTRSGLIPARMRFTVAASRPSFGGAKHVPACAPCWPSLRVKKEPIACSTLCDTTLAFT